MPNECPDFLQKVCFLDYMTFIPILYIMYLTTKSLMPRRDAPLSGTLCFDKKCILNQIRII